MFDTEDKDRGPALGSLSALMLVAGAVCSATVAPAQLVDEGLNLFVGPFFGIDGQADGEFGAVLASGDFDADGFADLAIGIPGRRVGVLGSAGAVGIIYGEPEGLGGGRAPLVVHQDVPGIADFAEAGDRFGDSLAAGDFNGDSFDDLAIGVPHEELSPGRGFSLPDAGALHLIAGTGSGLNLGSASFVTADDFFGFGVTQGDEFAHALVAVNLNFDSSDDLLIGVPGSDRGPSFDDEGAAFRVNGSPGGLVGVSALSYELPGRQAGDRYGSVLAAPTHGPGLAPEAVIGAPVAGANDEGKIWALRGGGFETLDGSGVDARLGTALAHGDFSGLGRDQLLVGIPGSSDLMPSEAGEVLVYDVVGSTMTTLSQGSGGVLDTPEAFDNFGEALAVGDFNRDGYHDAVIGVPHEDVLDGVDTGLVHVLYGGPGGLGSALSQVWSLPIAAAADDQFGAALAVGDFNGDSVDDLAIGAPSPSSPFAGTVTVFYGRDHALIFSDGFESGDVSSWSTP